MKLFVALSSSVYIVFYISNPTLSPVVGFEELLIKHNHEKNFRSKVFSGFFFQDRRLKAAVQWLLPSNNPEKRVGGSIKTLTHFSATFRLSLVKNVKKEKKGKNNFESTTFILTDHVLSFLDKKKFLVFEQLSYNSIMIKT